MRTTLSSRHARSNGKRLEQTPNSQHRTANIQAPATEPSLDVGRWMLDVRCSQAELPQPASGARSSRTRGSALIIVLWVCLGIVGISLYFAQSMTYEMRAADNRVAAVQAEEAIAGAARYTSNILANIQTPGLLPDEKSYEREHVPVGEAAFWFIGRSDQQKALDEPWFGLVDEGSKLNLNTATLTMLEQLPRMTPELAAAIIDWRDTNSTVTDGGAEDETYQRLNPPYRCKNAPFESIDELHLVYGMTNGILFGEDANLNGALDPNENDGDNSAPDDDRNGLLDPGLLEYVTVWSRVPTAGYTNVNDPQALAVVLQDALGTSRANQIRSQIATGGGQGGGGQTEYTNLVQFYLASLMSRNEFDQVSDALIATTNTTGYIDGLVNINTASEAVLECIPGIGTQYASTVVAYRLGNTSSLQSIAWLVEVVGSEAALQAGPYITTRSYQFTADIAAVGRYGRGYKRVKYIFDTSDGTPRIAYRQDLTDLGWALGRIAREDLQIANNTR
jgi:DNA uptake protein ComE-like DNA-binding protein